MDPEGRARTDRSGRTRLLAVSTRKGLALDRRGDTAPGRGRAASRWCARRAPAAQVPGPHASTADGHAAIACTRAFFKVARSADDLDAWDVLDGRQILDRGAFDAEMGQRHALQRS